ncbi:DUF2637 domain-containing protein [Streptomyces brevispora]|uniref:DUF2637 domain-containing protein n=1 Tax=Streptomyces brevispora TaxID=887462 RepID=UPI00371053BA
MLAATLIVLGGIAVGGLGFYASFDAVSTKAAQWGFTEPWVLPTAIDSAVPVFTGAYLLLIRMDMPLAWARLVPWALSLTTCALNVAAGNTLWSKVAHGAMSLLWVAVSEIAAHVYAVRIGAVTGRRRRLDKVRWSRWLLSPLPTFRLWRRMKLWELASYDTVLKLEQDRLVYQAKLQGKFGRNWRKKAPVEAVLPLRLARNGIPLAETAAEGLAAAGIDPTRVLPARPIPAELEAPRSASAPLAAAAPRKPTVTVPVQQKTPAPPAKLAGPEPAVDEHVGKDDREPISENDLYDVVVAALKANEAWRFAQGGDLTGTGMGRLLHQSSGNGRKVRNRILTRYASHLSDQGVAVPENFTIEDLMTTASV